MTAFKDRLDVCNTFDGQILQMSPRGLFICSLIPSSKPLSGKCITSFSPLH